MDNCLRIEIFLECVEGFFPGKMRNGYIRKFIFSWPFSLNSLEMKMIDDNKQTN